MRRLLPVLVVSLVLLGLGAAALLVLRREALPAAPAAPPPAVRVVRDGLSIAFELRPAAGGGPVTAPGEAVATFTLTDASTGAPVRGARPRGWLGLREPGARAPDDAACTEQVRTYLGGLLSVQAEVDLNAFLLLTLNGDNTLSVINPQLGFDRTKLRNLVTLGAAPADWVLHPDRDVLYVSLPATDRVAVVDLERFLATGSIPVGDGPTQLALAPDGRTLWVANAGDGTVSVVDHRTREVRETLRVGPGPHALAFSDGGRVAWVGSAGDTLLRAFDTATLEPLETVDVGRGVTALAVSEPARVLYAAHAERGTLSVVGTRARALAGRVALAPGLGALGFDPSGRWAFALNRARGEVAVLDASSGRVRHTLTGFQAPDALTFTRAYAYVRNTRDARVALVRLDSLDGAQAPAVVEVQMGQEAPAAARASPAASPFAPTPEGDGVVVAGTADRALYFYREGMMAPMGTLRNYGREPRAVLLLDRSLQEVQPGVYSTPVRVREPGTYDVAFALESPRVVTCLEQLVAAAPGAEARARARPLALEVLGARELTAGAPATLRFKLTGAGRPLPADALRVLVFRPPGTWQWRGVPRSAGPDTFEVDFVPPAPGQYEALVGAPAHGAPLGALRPVRLAVRGTEEGAP